MLLDGQIQMCDFTDEWHSITFIVYEDLATVVQ